MKQVAIASSKIGFLPVEHAFWILIPSDRSPAKWISATGQHDGLPTSIRLPVTVLYAPSEGEVAELLAAMRTCEFVIHVHNHPLEPYPGIKGSSDPSRDDFIFATAWRKRLSEVADRLKFFIVHGDEMVGYW
jgi:hypothetical protein